MVGQFTELRAWQQARVFNKQVYLLTQPPRFRGDRDLARQLRRASSSVPGNIAEGFGRRSFQDRLNFFHIAIGSLLEAESHLYLAHDIGYVSVEELEGALSSAETARRQLGGFMSSIRGSGPGRSDP